MVEQPLGYYALPFFESVYQSPHQKTIRQQLPVSASYYRLPFFAKSQGSCVLAILCGCTAWFVSDLGNPGCYFYCNENLSVEHVSFSKIFELFLSLSFISRIVYMLCNDELYMLKLNKIMLCYVMFIICTPFNTLEFNFFGKN